MIERYSIAASTDQLMQRYGIEKSEAYQPVYNAAPSQLLPVITHEHPQGFSFFFWGLPPKWVKGKALAEKTINIRAELIADKPVIRKNLVQRRCLIPADGFYCWKKVGKKTSIPWRFTFSTKEIVSWAGIWEEYEEEEENFHTFQMITRPSPSAIAEVTDRIPVILTKETEKLWLNPTAAESDLLLLLNKAESPKMDGYSVSPQLNSPGFNKPSLLLPAPPSDQFGNLTLFD